MILQSTPDFYEQEDEKADKNKFRFLYQYLRPHKKLIVQLVVGLIVGSLLQLIFPFLTQSIVDFGIANNNLNFIYLVLIVDISV